MRGLQMKLAMLPLLAWGQGYTASVTGVVRDPAAAPAAGLTVNIINEETSGRAYTTTDSQGRYTVPGLAPGDYRVEIRHPGFKAISRTGLRLEVDQVARLDLKLELGELSQSVEVREESPLITTESSSRGQVITQREIADFPMESRDWFGLAFLVPGVMPTADGLGEDKNYANINGARHREMNFLVDGSNNKSARYGEPSAGMVVDTIREFKVQSSNYSAEFGRMSSGVLNAALKSGTNRFSGMGYLYHRNMAFDARNFFDAGKSELIRNQYGGNLGGPLIRDKAFFFGSYEGRRGRDGAPRRDVAPSAAFRAGDFSTLSFAITDPMNGNAPFPGKRIPQNRFHPTSVKVQDYFPGANIDVPIGAYNFFNSRVTERSSENVLAKGDWNVRPGDTLSLRYNFSTSDDVEPFRASNFPGFESTNAGTRHNAGLNYTRMILPTVVNQLTLSYSRASGAVLPLNGDTNYSEVLGIPGITQDPSLLGFPYVTIRNYGVLADRDPVRWTTNDYQLTDAVNVMKSGHNLRFGGEAIRTELSELVASQSRGRFTFRGRWTSTSSDSLKQEPYADFLLGLLDAANRRVNPITNYVGGWTMGAYIQDDWKLRPDLTLNLGVRYEILLPPTEKHGQWTSFIPEAARIVISGDAAYPKPLVFADRNNFAPRVGFAWRPRGNRGFVVRAGYGLFYAMNLLGEIQGSLGTNPPFTVQENYARVASNPSFLTWSNPFPQGGGSLAGVTSPRGFELRPPNSYLQNYNLTLERELNRFAAVELGYVGSKGTHLGHRWDLNQPLRGADIPRPFPRPYPAYSTINYFSFDSNSSFHSLQAGLRWRKNNINLRVNYTLAKSIDEGSTFTDAATGGFTGLQDSRNRALERGPSDFDRRHAFVASSVYELPVVVSQRAGWMKALLNGWQTGLILRLYSGTPFTARTSNSNVDLGEAQRPDRIGSGALDDPRPEMWFNARDFLLVPIGSYRFGNAGRNILNSAGRILVDASVMKTFRITERQRLQFRWEVFNAPNHANFLTPNTSVDSPSVGVVTRAMTARQMQAALKYMF